MARLIDADKLETHEEIVPLGNGMYETTFIVYKDDIDEQPTVDAVPVRHGKWIRYPIAEGMNKCSECGVLRFGCSNYCPHCGARMDTQ